MSAPDHFAEILRKCRSPEVRQPGVGANLSDQDWAREFKRGGDAFRAGEPYDHTETDVWKLGFGDAIAIQIVGEI